MICFAEFELDPATGELSKHGATVRLEPQPAAVLVLLASRSGQLVTRDELRRALWDDGTHVNVQDGLSYAIRRVRLALGDDPRSPRFIETIPKRGYRFLNPLVQSTSVAADTDTRRGHDSASGVTGDVRSSRIRRGVLALAIAATVAGTVVVERRPNRHHEIAVHVLETLHDAVFPSSANPR